MQIKVFCDCSWFVGLQIMSTARFNPKPISLSVQIYIMTGTIPGILWILKIKSIDN